MRERTLTPHGQEHSNRDQHRAEHDDEHGNQNRRLELLGEEERYEDHHAGGAKAGKHDLLECDADDQEDRGTAERNPQRPEHPNLLMPGVEEREGEQPEQDSCARDYKRRGLARRQLPTYARHRPDHPERDPDDRVGPLIDCGTHEQRNREGRRDEHAEREGELLQQEPVAPVHDGADDRDAEEPGKRTPLARTRDVLHVELRGRRHDECVGDMEARDPDARAADQHARHQQELLEPMRALVGDATDEHATDKTGRSGHSREPDLADDAERVPEHAHQNRHACDGKNAAQVAHDLGHQWDAYRRLRTSGLCLVHHGHPQPPTIFFRSEPTPAMLSAARRSTACSHTRAQSDSAPSAARMPPNR